MRVTNAGFRSVFVTVTRHAVWVAVVSRSTAITLASGYVGLAPALAALGVTLRSGRVFYARVGAVAFLASYQRVATKRPWFTGDALWAHRAWGADAVTRDLFT